MRRDKPKIIYCAAHAQNVSVSHNEAYFSCVYLFSPLTRSLPHALLGSDVSSRLRQPAVLSHVGSNTQLGGEIGRSEQHRRAVLWR